MNISSDNIHQIMDELSDIDTSIHNIDVVNSDNENICEDIMDYYKRVSLILIGIRMTINKNELYDKSYITALPNDL